MLPPVVYTIADLASALGRSKASVRELIDKGEFPVGQDVNGRQLWSVDDVEWFKLSLGVRPRLKPQGKIKSQ